jgi:hypothetical protein
MTLEHRRRIDILLDPDYLTNLESVGLATLRDRRRMADEVETELSFYRRLLHGRMDLLAFELNRRSGEETRSLIEALPEILGAGERAGGQQQRVPQVLAPDLPEERRRHIDRVLGDDFLSRLPECATEELDQIQDVLAETEQEVSTSRKAVQHVFDTIQAEIMRRYKEGQVDSDELPVG